jgi:hypothetical protein
MLETALVGSRRYYTLVAALLFFILVGFPSTSCS